MEKLSSQSQAEKIALRIQIIKSGWKWKEYFILFYTQNTEVIHACTVANVKVNITKQVSGWVGGLLEKVIELWKAF